MSEHPAISVSSPIAQQVVSDCWNGPPAIISGRREARTGAGKPLRVSELVIR